MALIQNRDLEYALVDVFAERPLEGNQLAIFTDARGLTDTHMQALAREMNLAETTFIFPADDPAQEVAQGVRVRIFTTQEELHFAGHPTLGTASWLYWHHAALAGAECITLRLNAGDIPVTFETPATDEPGVFASMRQLDPTFGLVHERQQAATALGLTLEDLDPDLPVQTVSTGTPFCIVPLRSMEVMQRLAIPQRLAVPYLAARDAKFFYCVVRLDDRERRDGMDVADFHLRMQFYNGEDPATGSAAGCAIAYLVKHGVVASGRPTVFEQGIAINRPSKLYVRATLRDGNVSGVVVGGRTIPVAKGQLFQR